MNLLVCLSDDHVDDRLMGGKHIYAMPKHQHTDDREGFVPYLYGLQLVALRMACQACCLFTESEPNTAECQVHLYNIPCSTQSGLMQ